MNLPSEKKQIFGIINVNKPFGITSHDVVSRLRKILKIKQIGHTGTLDPMATGVLPICTGKATRLIEYLSKKKSYRAFVKLGVITDTYDMEGKILSQQAVKLDIDLIKEKLTAFVGDIKQKPPIYSAIHHKGKRLYEYARNNVEVTDIPYREVTINSINIVDIQEKDTDNPVLVLDIDCSGGTYIRSIAYDLGESIKCGACLSGLIRTGSGGFSISESLNLDEIETFANNNNFDKIFINPVNAIDLEKLEVNEDIIKKVSQGQYFIVNEHMDFAKKILLTSNDKLVAIATHYEKLIKPEKVFI